MEGERRGFDINSKEGIEQWIAVQNAGAGAPRPPLPAPREAPVVIDRRATEARRRKRKLPKASRRKNR
jgi:hypothetical protein